MAKQIKQFRYYNDGNANNSPSALTAAKLADGSAFSGISAITQIGIQTLPGVRVHFNGDDAIIIGPTGVYELDINGISEITKLSFEKNSLDTIGELPNAYLIIDMICE